MKVRIKSLHGRGPWVVEFSQSQRCFHVHQLGDALYKNLGMFLRAARCDYAPIVLVETREDASAFIKAFDQRPDRDEPFTANDVQAAATAWLKWRKGRGVEESTALDVPAPKRIAG